MTIDAAPDHVPSSFRDPSGFVFIRDARLYRQVNESYREEFDRFTDSGLYDALVASGLLISHREMDLAGAGPGAYKLILPERIPFISYPYEWCFSQLKDAALTTLRIQRMALDRGMVLKDASAFNIQFRNGRPVFIDTLSFDIYREGEPWVAYRQFCQHFLAPLALMSCGDIHLGQLSRIFIDGPPLDLASKLLPFRALLRPGLFVHIAMHARSQARYAALSGTEDARAGSIGSGRGTLSMNGMRGMIDNIESTVQGLQWMPAGTEWGDYYDDTNYSSAAMQGKMNLVSEYLRKSNANTVWDIGANTGVFSRIAADLGMQTISMDIDPAAVEKNYLECRASSRRNLLPLVLDISNPSPAIGWENRERESFFSRGPVDAVLALALVHHLAISNNVPLTMIAELFSSTTKHLIIEFVPKSDSQVRRLLATRKDIFPGYTQAGFEEAFRKHFVVEDFRPVHDSDRTLYFMRRT